MACCIADVEFQLRSPLGRGQKQSEYSAIPGRADEMERGIAEGIERGVYVEGGGRLEEQGRDGGDVRCCDCCVECGGGRR